MAQPLRRPEANDLAKATKQSAKLSQQQQQQRHHNQQEATVRVRAQRAIGLELR